MNDLRSNIIENLSALIVAMNNPYSPDSTTEGWDAELWIKWGNIFSELLDSVRSGGLGPDASISRAMDFDGITKGQILEEAA